MSTKNIVSFCYPRTLNQHTQSPSSEPAAEKRRRTRVRLRPHQLLRQRRTRHTSVATTKVAKTATIRASIALSVRRHPDLDRVRVVSVSIPIPVWIGIFIIDIVINIIIIVIVIVIVERSRNCGKHTRTRRRRKRMTSRPAGTKSIARPVTTTARDRRRQPDVLILIRRLAPDRACGPAGRERKTGSGPGLSFTFTVVAVIMEVTRISNVPHVTAPDGIPPRPGPERF